MYNPGHGSSGSEFTNNPFINDPNNPSTRYPDISGSTITSPDAQNLSAGQFTSWQPSALNTGFPTGVQAQPGVYQQSSFQPQSYNTGSIPQQFLGAQQPSQPFQPTSSFGQQLSVQLSGSSYGYLHGQNTGMPQTEYNPVQQQLQNNPGYTPQFDPYASIGQGWDGQTQNQNQNQNQIHPLQSPTQSTFSSSGNQHPREYIRTHKAEIESWDTYAWKQLLGAFDALKDSWEARKKELQDKIAQLQVQLQHGGGYYAMQIQQEGSRLQVVRMIFQSANPHSLITLTVVQRIELKFWWGPRQI
jgi:hypothetical protein